MRGIDILQREQMISAQGGKVNRRTKIPELCDDESTPYAILSHRWINLTKVGQ